MVEVTRKIVRRFNSLYKPVLIEPDTLLGSCPRLIGLDGNAKMSKSMGNVIFLSDDAETVLSKVKTAVTGPKRITLRDKGHPEVCVVNEYHRILNFCEYDNICSMCCNAAIGCTVCKKRLSDVINGLLSPIRERRAVLEQKHDEIIEVLQFGNDKAKLEGSETVRKVKEAMSMNYYPLC